MKRVIWPDDAKLEGVGILPDVQVASLREARYAGHDRALERAQALVAP
jgi:C-terminal processing protease CtpA/Prc